MSGLAHRTQPAARPARLPVPTDRRGVLWRLDRVLQEVPLSRSTIRRKELDGTFPRRVRLSGNSVAWWSGEVEAWKAARPEIDSS